MLMDHLLKKLISGRPTAADQRMLHFMANRLIYLELEMPPTAPASFPYVLHEAWPTMIAERPSPWARDRN